MTCRRCGVAMQSGVRVPVVACPVLNGEELPVERCKRVVLPGGRCTRCDTAQAEPAALARFRAEALAEFRQRYGATVEVDVYSLEPVPCCLAA